MKQFRFNYTVVARVPCTIIIDAKDEQDAEKSFEYLYKNISSDKQIQPNTGMQQAIVPYDYVIKTGPFEII